MTVYRRTPHETTTIIQRALHTGVCPDDGETCCWGGEFSESDDCDQNDLTALAEHIAKELRRDDA